MANAVLAQMHGHDYQARVFWMFAARLRDPDRPNVTEVTYEADGPKAFDDIVVRYDPPRRSQTDHQIPADYHQIKFHVTEKGRFGYADLIDPKFIAAKKTSVLQRLRDARQNAPEGSAFILTTTDKIFDDDPLNELISKVDQSFRLDVLEKGKTGDSRMGAVRKLWREHLELVDDAELFAILKDFHIQSSHHSLEALREQVNLNFRVVGLISCENSMGFLFDQAARALLAKGINRLTRETFEALCQQEGWIRKEPQPPMMGVAIQSFAAVTSFDRLRAVPANILSLLDEFDGRFPKDAAGWQHSIKPQIDAFLEKMLGIDTRMRLFLDAHSSIAFLAGKDLGLKSGAEIELVQMGQRGISVWRADDGLAGSEMEFALDELSDGKDLAVVVSLARSAKDDVRAYAEAELPSVGRLIAFAPASGAGQLSLAGGRHAAMLAEQVAGVVAKTRKPGARVHVFISGPNAFSFFLGQHAASMGRCIPYEFDFGGHVDGTYRPTFEV